MVKKIHKTDVEDAFEKIGKKISERRKSLRKKFPGISKKLNISINFLKYIEEGKVDKIPDHVPVKGFVKTYAKFLKVNIEEELGIVEQKFYEIEKKIDSQSSVKHNFKFYFFYFILIFIFLLLVSYLINFDNKKNNDGENFYGLKNNTNFLLIKRYSLQKFFGKLNNMFYFNINNFE